MATALFVIDIQNDLATDPATQIPHAERVKVAGHRILSTARTVLGAQNKGTTTPGMIFFVQHEEEPESGPLVRGSEPWKLVFEPRADVQEERLVSKWTRPGDTFESNPDLGSELRAVGVQHIIALGIQSECCVESTCSGALAAGFEVTLLSGAHSTYNSGNKTAEEVERDVEERLLAKGAKIVLWEEAVGLWK
ncbi:Isochorismatase-like protein [Chaetomium tenue]|uniref:Isochorismatase-like protein n=1 Tax=Chaetomium tenue TaxID=1854479 RepID=A0ACB7PJ42_9PEZI|nr:Isochorismatase-like protein [Chaetomium globosum]